MVGKAFWPLALALLGFGIVAMVRGQDSSSGSTAEQSPTGAARGGQFTPVGGDHNSVRPARSPSVLFGASGLAERLKALRQSSGGSHVGSPANSSTKQPVRSRQSQPSTSRPAPVFTPLRKRPTPASGAPAPQSPAAAHTKAAPAPAPAAASSPISSPPVDVASKLPSVLKRPIPGTTGQTPAATETPPSRSVHDPTQPSATSTAVSSRRADHAVPPPDRTARRLVPELSTSKSERSTLSVNDVISAASSGPALRVETTGPRAITIGKPERYVVTVTNLTDVAAEDVTVAVRLPQWVDVVGSQASSGSAQQHAADQQGALIWTIDRVAGRAKAQLTLNVVARENRPVDLAVDWTFRPPTATARIVVQQPQLEMALSGPADVLYGETKVYTVTVSNPGTGDAENVVVRLPELLGGGERMVGTVKAGRQEQIEVALTARQAGEVAIQAEAVADGGLHAQAVQRVLVRRAALLVEASGPKFKYAGNVAKYQLRIANVGDAMAEEVVGAVALPAGAKLLGGLEGAEQVEGGLRWTIGSMSPGAERFYEVTCVLNQDGQNELHAGARAAGDLAASDTVVTAVEALADVKLEVEDPQGPQPVGSDVVYKTTVANRGTKAARDVKVVMQFSEGIEPVSVDGAQADIVPGQVLFRPIPRLEAGQELQLTVHARAERAGNHVFRVVVTCPEPDTRRVAEGTTRFFGDQ